MTEQHHEINPLLKTAMTASGQLNQELMNIGIPSHLVTLGGVMGATDLAASAAVFDGTTKEEMLDALKTMFETAMERASQGYDHYSAKQKEAA